MQLTGYRVQNAFKDHKGDALGYFVEVLRTLKGKESTKKHNKR